MTSHFLKLSEGARIAARRVFSDSQDPSAAAVDDLTHGGRTLQYAPLPRSDQGVRIRIQGSRAQAEAGLEANRLDTLFVYRLESRPTGAPAGSIRYGGSFRELVYLNAAEVDEVGPLFRVEAPVGVETLPTSVPTQQGRLVISGRISSALASAPASLRSNLYPRVDDGALTLDVLRPHWRRLVATVRRGLGAPTRNHQILDASITPSHMSDGALRELRSYFEVVFVSQVLAEQVEPQDRLFALTSEFGLSPVPTNAARAALWSAMTRSLSPVALREEVRTIAPFFQILVEREERPWWDAINGLVGDLSTADGWSAADQRARDALGVLLLEADDAEETALRFLARWAKKSVPASVPAPPAREESISLAAQGAAQLADSAKFVPALTETAAAAMGALETMSDESALHAWVMQQRGVTPDLARDLRTEIESLVMRASEVAESLHSVRGWLEAPLFGRQARDMVEKFPLAFSDRSKDWQELLAQSEAALVASIDAAGREASITLISRKPVQPVDLREAAGLFKQHHLWSHLPAWWWSLLPAEAQGADGPVSTGNSELDRLEVFCAPRARNLTRTACERLKALPEDLLSGVAAFPSPPDGTSADDHLAAEIDRLSRVLGRQRQKYATSLTAFLDDGRISPQEFAEYADSLDTIERSLSAQAFADLLEECHTRNAPDRLRAFVRQVRQVVDIGGRPAGERASQEERDEWTRHLAWPLLRRRLDQLPVSDAATIVSIQELRLHYADVGTREDPTDKPPLFFRPHGDDLNAAFGSVCVPIILKSPHQRTLDVQIRARDGNDPLRRAWPSSGGHPSSDVRPAIKSIRERDWHADGDEYHLAVPLSVPIRRPSVTGQGLEFELEIQDAATGQRLAQRAFTWERLVTHPEDVAPALDLEWSNAEDPDYARDVPVGPQVHLDQILERIRGGNSLAVTAPRRFGKSSLIALLEQRLKNVADAVSVRVDCSAATPDDSASLDPVKLWELVSEQLQGVTQGVGLESRHDGQRPSLPVPESFQKVRAQAARLGKRRVVVFFDEAQRMLAAGPAFGARLRTLIATHIGTRVDGLATVVLCFVGLPSMTRARLGEDLYPLLNPLTHDELREEQVARVIKRVTGGALYTTRAARDRIARVSWNLYALRTILSRLRRHVRDDCRMWATVEDVIAVEKALSEELRSGRDPESIATYIRDTLNEGATADEFHPIAAYPVATAYAVALNDNRVGKDALEATVLTLRDWSNQIFREQLSRPIYDTGTVERQLKTLEEQGVLDHARDALGGYRFRSDFLRHYLIGKAPYHVYGDDVFREAMLRGGTRTVRLPADKTPLGQGAQASVYRFTRDTEMVARVRELRSPQEQSSFLDSLVLLDKISSIHKGHHDGAEGIYKLVDVGLLDESGPVKAVEVYHYVPGVDLGAKVGQLGVAAVVEIGKRLARAVGLVHEHDVLHRDIRPQNVILQDHVTVPVLIDFGLACARSAPGGTPLDDELTAPEVKGPQPRWSAAADVYAAAMTLRKLLAKTRPDEKALDAELGKITVPDVAVRSSVAALEQILERTSTAVHMVRQQHDYSQLLLDIVQEDQQEAYLRWLITDGCKLEVAGFALGLYGKARDRAERVAVMVNKVAERMQRRSIGAWAREEFGGQWPREIAVLVNLRNDATHPDPRSPPVNEALIRAGVLRVSTWLGTQKLGALVDHLLKERTG